MRTLPGDLCVKEHTLKVPVDHAAVKGGPTLDLFVREVRQASKISDADLPCLLYLQGGPGFPSPRPSCPPTGWMASALSKFRVLLLDQRGTGQSTPVSAEALEAIGGPEAQAEYLSHFRADSIVRDCEIVRSQLNDGKPLTLLGQSFGGFCILTYLSLFPHAVERALVTFGLAPVGRSADEVYTATFKRMEERNRRFYSRYPEDVELVRSIVRALHDQPVPLPRGGTLTARRFLQLGLLLGSGAGLETLHDLLELARPALADPARALRLPYHFLVGVENAQSSFETNPLYFLLHEALYSEASGIGSAACAAPSAWAEERVQASLGPSWDYTAALADPSAPPLLFSGEMVFSWMAEDYAALRPLGPVAQLLAQREWGALYDAAALAAPGAPVAALVSYEDIYVERAFSEAVGAMLGDRSQLWITNEFQHSGLRDAPATVFDRLLAMAKGELAIPS